MRIRTSRARNLFATIVQALVFLVLLRGVGRADEGRCDGPPECCAKELVGRLPEPLRVQLGVVFVGISNVNEKSGTWDADFYLYERWPPTSGFTPQTEIVNEAERHATQFDTTQRIDGFASAHGEYAPPFALRTICEGSPSTSNTCASSSPTTSSPRRT